MHGAGRVCPQHQEGQYYLTPLFLVTTPLIFLTLAPGVEVEIVFSLVPITNVALLLVRFC